MLLNTIKTKLSVVSHPGQFNLTLFLLLCASIVLFYLSLNSSNSTVQIIGFIVCCFLIIGIMIVASLFHIRQSPRTSEATPKITVSSPNGKKIELVNPPDACYSRDQMNTLLRGFLVGYDENLIADGEVKGPASEQEYIWYSPEQKVEFQKKHREEIAGKKKEIRRRLRLLDSPSDEDTESTGK